MHIEQNDTPVEYKWYTVACDARTPTMLTYYTRGEAEKFIESYAQYDGKATLYGMTDEREMVLLDSKDSSPRTEA